MSVNKKLKFEKCQASYVDSFTRANSTTSVGPNWTNQLGTLGITSNHTYPPTTFQHNMASWNNTMASDNIWVQGKLAGTWGFQASVWMGGTDHQAVALLQSGTTLYIYLSNSYTPTTSEASASVTFSAGDVLALGRQGNVYTAYQNGVSKVTWTDSGNAVARNATHRMVGIHGYSLGAPDMGFSNFAAFDL